MPKAITNISLFHHQKIASQPSSIQIVITDRGEMRLVHLQSMCFGRVFPQVKH